MNIIFSKSDSVDKEQADQIRQMEYIHSQCVDFRLSCCNYNGKWGVWQTLGKERILVDPLSLVNSLFIDDTYSIFILNEDQKYKSCCVDVHKDLFCMTWNTSHPDSPIKGQLMFRFDEYIAQIAASVERLYEEMKSGGAVCYCRFDLNLVTLEIAVAQLRIKSTLPSVYRLKAYDVIIDELEFSPLSCDQYRIGIGDRNFTSYMVHRCANLELIRHQLESVYYREDATIKIFDELDDCVLKIEHKSILDEVIHIEDGYRYTYKDFAKVTIQPNSFVLTPIIVGYCELNNAIRSFYEGLLRMALLHDEKEYDHTPGRIEAYNMCKSPLIETYLSDNKISFCKSSIRQVRITEILTISPDYDYYLINQDNCAIDIGDLHDEHGCTIEMPELEAWSSEIRRAIVDTAVGQDVAFDWNNWHIRGIKLAKQLRRQLPSCYDLWYNAPSEDKSGIIKNEILII